MQQPDSQSTDPWQNPATRTADNTAHSSVTTRASPPPNHNCQQHSNNAITDTGLTGPPDDKSTASTLYDFSQTSQETIP
jgi:hypothetical protein